MNKMIDNMNIYNYRNINMNIDECEDCIHMAG